MELISQDRKARAASLLNGRGLVFSLSQGQATTHNPRLFRELVEMAADFGATHIEVGRLPFRYGTSFLPDNTDPYAAWCNTSFGLLWGFPTEEMLQWIPRADVEWRQEILAEQMAELRRFGLKGVIDSVEPLWLPEEVYRAHPRWRGAQCELGRIARRPYFAPCVSEPEVLGLYRHAVRSLCEVHPDIDQLKFMSNDSGAGIDWTPNTYPGMNGHNRWRGGDAGKRIAGWLQALQEGAAEAGTTSLRVHLHSSGLPVELKNSARNALGPDQYIGFADANNEPWSVANANLGSGVWSFAYPAAGMADPAAFVAGLQNVYSNPAQDTFRTSISIDESNLPTGRVLLEEFLDHPGSGLAHRTALLLTAAGRLCGHEARFGELQLNGAQPTATEKHAETLVAAWNSIQQAVHAISHVGQKGFSAVLPFCGVSMRWVTRPLVPQPQLLTAEETEYYTRRLFSVDDGDEKYNLCNVLGKPVFRGESVMWLARWTLQEAIATLRVQQQTLKTLAAELEGEAAARIALFSARAGALACLALNAQNVIRYQYALDVAHQPSYGLNVMDYDENILYDQRGLLLRKIAREELDNIEELIELVQSHEGTVVIHAATPDEESVFLLGPDLLGDLGRKRDIMMDHWQDYETLYPATKVWEFEPKSGGG